MRSKINLLPLLVAAMIALGITTTGRLAAPALAVERAPAATLDHQKLAVAKQLTDWLQKTMLEKRAIAAVVSRKGGKDLKGKDRTGMAHSALAIYDPRAQTWILYQVLGTTDTGQPVAELWRMAPVDFFYGQTGYEANALLLVPDTETQQRVYQSILNGKAFRLAFTKDYNLLSEYDSEDSLNCNKWILMTLAAARSDEYDPNRVLDIIHRGFEPGKLRMNFIEKTFAKQKANVRSREVPTFGPVRTVTPESLYDSGLFPEKLFASHQPF